MALASGFGRKHGRPEPPLRDVCVSVTSTDSLSLGTTSACLVLASSSRVGGRQTDYRPDVTVPRKTRPTWNFAEQKDASATSLHAVFAYIRSPSCFWRVSKVPAGPRASTR